MVVFHHARFFAGAAPAWLTKSGAAGVDIFFVISGFIMAYTTADAAGPRLAAARAFLRRRFIRVVPLYWLALLWTAHSQLLHGHPDHRLLMDFLFLPHTSVQFPPEIWPCLVPGWTINYEMFFYVLFGGGLLLGRGRLWFVVAVLVALATLGFTLPVRGAAALFYTHDVILEFALGIGVFVLWRRFGAPRGPGWLPWLVLAAGFLLLMLPNGFLKVVCDGLPAAAIVYAGIFTLGRVRAPLLKILGDASYSIYLFHLAAFALMAKFWNPPAAAFGTTGLLWVIALRIALAALAGTALHYALERPMLAWLRRRLEPGAA